MKKVFRNGTKEAVGCFCMLILASIMTLGGMVIIFPAVIAALAGKPAAGIWRSVLIWVVAPGVGMALVAWLTYGFKGRGDAGRRS